jgi:transposase
MSKQPTVLEFMERFPTDDACLEHLMRVRYGDRHTCGKCGRDAHYYRVTGRQCYECEYCGYQVFPQVGTAFEKSSTSLRKWFYAMYLFCSSRHGVSGKELQRQLGVTYKTAWRMAKLIREYMGQVDGDSPVGGAGKGAVEIDETFIGGKDKRGYENKIVVMGMAERGGEVITRVVPNRYMKTVLPHIRQNVPEGSRVMTDDWSSYRSLSSWGYKHEVVNHSAKEYVRGDAHTNEIEGFWSIIKRSIRSTHVWVSPKYLETYLGSFEFVWNLRKQPQLMFDLLLVAFPHPVRREP